jgi:hypothetical protein
MTPERFEELAAEFNVAPKDAAAVSLMHAGRADLIAAVLDRRLTVRAALTAARKNPVSC